MKNDMDKYDPEKFEENFKRDDFMMGRLNRSIFKPMPIAPVRVARSCANCIYNKGSSIQDLQEFAEYGLAFYYGFIACTLHGRTPDKCMVTDANGVCKHHKFDEALKGHTRDMPRALWNLSRAIKDRTKK